MADGRRSHTARPEEISYMDDDVSEFDPNVPNNDMDARLFRLLSNEKKTDLSKRQPLPRDRSLGLRIPSARFPRGLDLHKGESHGPVPALVTSPVHDHADDIVGLRPAPDDTHASASSATPSRATPTASGHAQGRNDSNDYSYAHQAAHVGGGEPPHNGGAYDHNAFDRAVGAGNAPTARDSGDAHDHAHQYVVGFDDPYAAPAAYDNGGGHGASDYPNQDEGPDAFSLAVQEAQQHSAPHDDGAAEQTHAWSLPSDGSASVAANTWQESDAIEHAGSAAAASDHTWFGVAEAAAMATGPHDGDAHHHHQQQQQQEVPVDGFSTYPPQYATASSSSSSSSSSHNGSAQDGNAYNYQDNAYDQRESYPSQSQPGPSSSSSSSSAYSQHRSDASSSYGAGATAHDPYAEERKAKHAALLNLSQIEESGGVLSRKFTMDDPYDEIEYELDAYHHRRNHIQSIEMVHDKLKMVETVLLLVNGMGGRLFKRKGPIIPPDQLKKAWHETLDKHKVVIENVARKRYGPHAGSSAQSPEIQLGTALAMGISGPILMGLFMDHLMGGGGGGNSAPSSSGDRARDGERQRRRRDDKRPALRRHRDAASGSDWRGSHNDYNNNNGAGNYPEPPQDPFSRVPSLHTPHPQHVASWASPGTLPPQQAHMYADPAAAAAVAQPNQYGQANWESPLPAGHAPQGAPTPQMDPYAHTGSPWPRAHAQPHSPVDYQQQQQQQPYYPQQQYQQQQQQQPYYPPQQPQHQQQGPPYVAQEQQPHAYAPQPQAGSAQQHQQRQHAQQTPYAAGGERVAHTHAAPIAQRAPSGSQPPQQPPPPPHHEATPRQQPQPQQQATPSGAAPQGRRLMGRIAKPR
ncbi:hypothetical protein pmac_cds_253 [Pandoravirus macleodensis]|uniref:Uncharacterized protein n=1 Tax=Pandoravirus macleodensis TaxID=2107707 RepID=A0A2U7UEP0_9VIRU|nr:hypothetical protein pmac_cds_253 [Pandoravirus macleodensis]AVK76941.1 hypothetical protein pmac_cds_253 [Pandoravirus macleodensis]